MDRVSEWTERRAVPVVATMVIFVPSWPTALLAHRVVHVGKGSLVSPSDLWSLTNSSSAILHGHFSGVYVRHGALTSPPALEFRLVAGPGPGALRWPVAPPPRDRPAAQPVVRARPDRDPPRLDGVVRRRRGGARRGGFANGQRMVLALAARSASPTWSACWGHPEDCLAVAFVLWAALTMDRRGATGAPRAALLLGSASPSNRWPCSASFRCWPA